MLSWIIAPPSPPLNTPLRNPCTSTCQTIMCFHLSDISCGRSTEITDTILYKRVCTYKLGCLRLRRPTSNWEKIPYRLKEKNHKCCVNLFFLDLLSPFHRVVSSDTRVREFVPSLRKDNHLNVNNTNGATRHFLQSALHFIVS